MPQHRHGIQRLGARQQAQRLVPTQLRARATSSCRRCRTPTATGCAPTRRPPWPGWPPASYAEGAGRIGIDTAYRSYATQKALYDKYLALRGRTWTDTWYLRAGYSEHQTGLTVDLLPIGRSNCTINDCIDETPAGRLAGEERVAVRVPPALREGPDLDDRVGFEPWHFRYVGGPARQGYHDGGWHTYEQFLGQPAAPTY